MVPAAAASPREDNEIPINKVKPGTSDEQIEIIDEEKKGRRRRNNAGCFVSCCRWWWAYRRISSFLRYQQALAIALLLLLGILRLIYLRTIEYYIHKLFAFYFIIFALVLLFMEAEARTI